MGVTYLQGDILTAEDLNNSLNEAVNTYGYFVFSATPVAWENRPIGPPGEHVHNAKLTANGVFVVNTNPSYFYSQSNFYNDINIYSGNIVVSSGSLNVTGNVISSGSISDNIGDIRKVPRNNSVPNGYTVQSTDAGKFLNATGTVNVPGNIFNIGDNVTIFNSTSGSITIAQTGGTLILAGIGTTGNKSLDTKGLATILCVDTNVYAITGAGLN
jgi:hypothetical protein